MNEKELQDQVDQLTQDLKESDTAAHELEKECRAAFNYISILPQPSSTEAKELWEKYKGYFSERFNEAY